MQHIKNLKRYTPEELFLGENVIYLQDDNGIDWYAAQKLFSPDTVKLAYDESGIICAINSDVSMLWPIGLSVIELNLTKLPKRCLANGEWVFDGKKVSQRAYSAEEMMARAEAKKMNYWRSRVRLLRRFRMLLIWIWRPRQKKRCWRTGKNTA